MAIHVSAYKDQIVVLSRVGCGNPELPGGVLDQSRPTVYDDETLGPPYRIGKRLKEDPKLSAIEVTACFQDKRRHVIGCVSKPVSVMILTMSLGLSFRTAIAAVSLRPQMQRFVAAAQ